MYVHLCVYVRVWCAGRNVVFVVCKCSSRQAQTDTHSQSAISVPLSGHIPYYKDIPYLKVATTGK